MPALSRRRGVRETLSSAAQSGVIKQNFHRASAEVASENGLPRGTGSSHSSQPCCGLRDSTVGGLKMPHMAQWGAGAASTDVSARDRSRATQGTPWGGDVGAGSDLGCTGLCRGAHCTPNHPGSCQLAHHGFSSPALAMWSWTGTSQLIFGLFGFGLFTLWGWEQGHSSPGAGTSRGCSPWRRGHSAGPEGL